MAHDLTTCRICSFSNANVIIVGDANGVSCPRCGHYRISSAAIHQWFLLAPTNRQKINAASWIRAHPEIHLDVQEIDFLSTLTPPSVAERSDSLLIALNKEFPKTGQKISLPFDKPVEMMRWFGIAWCEDQEELIYLLRSYLIEGMQFLDFVSGRIGDIQRVLITAKGYQYLEELNHNSQTSNIGFCAMWFDPRVKPVWEQAICPAITDAGYVPKRIDSHEHNNRIDDEIMAVIRKSKFVVADFLGNRGGVYFEAGFALGLGIPVIWTCRESRLHKVHFDNRQYSFVVWEPENLNDFRERLHNRIEATIGRGLL